jgi:hypothetical protein
MHALMLRFFVSGDALKALALIEPTFGARRLP